MSGFDNDVVKDFNEFLHSFYADLKANSKILNLMIDRLIEEWEKENDKIE